MTLNGIDRFLKDPKLLSLAQGRVAVLGHPASLTQTRQHTLDALVDAGVALTCAFGPQHGMRGDKQDNMVETPNDIDPKHQLPVYSLYGDVRRPTTDMLAHFDTLLIDLQDVGTRIYTFLTTLFYLMEDLSKHDKRLIVLDRPNPAGRKCEGFILESGWESFVGAAPIQMRHGLTLGEAALWYRDLKNINIDLHIVALDQYDPDATPGFGWPHEFTWVNPSPNASSLNMARCFPGTVLLEGTTLSEGRGTTVPLEVLGAPQLDQEAILSWMKHNLPQHWTEGAWIRPMFFEPTFHKHQGLLCNGFQFHTDIPEFSPDSFHAFRLIVGMLKAIRTLSPHYEIWRKFKYEYENDRLAIDLIAGGPSVREFVDGSHTPSTIDAFEKTLISHEEKWLQERKPFILYSKSGLQKSVHSNVV